MEDREGNASMEWRPAVNGGPLARNPYAAPSAPVSDAADPGGRALASRWSRLAAVVIDWLAFVVPAVSMAIVVPWMASAGVDTLHPDTAPTAFIAGFGLLMVGLVAWQLILLHRHGQTIGKRMLGIRIVRADGSRAGFLRLLLLRYLAPGVVGAIPYLGFVFAIMDALFIFGERRRCLHDLLADTIVVGG